MTRSDRVNLGKGLAFIAPWLIGFLALTVVPVGLSLYFSFCDFPLLQRPAWIGLDNYRDLLASNEFWISLKNTLVYATIALPCGLLVSLGLAILLNQPIRGQAIYRTFIFLPSLVPAVASAMLWLWIYNSRFGLLNALFSRFLNIDGPTWLDANWAMPSLIFMSLWGVGNTVVIYLAGLQDVPRELYEAAEIDGANPVQRLFNVTLPILSPVIFFNLIMGIIGTLQVFAVPFIMTGGGPDNATLFYTGNLYDNAFKYLHMGYASALAWIQLLIILVLTGVAFYSSKKWVHYQGK